MLVVVSFDSVVVCDELPRTVCVQAVSVVENPGVDAKRLVVLLGGFLFGVCPKGSVKLLR